MDLGDRYSYFFLIDSGSGELVEEGRVRTTPKDIRGKFGALDPCRIAIEVGTHSPWVSRLLEELGHPVLVANARKFRLVHKSGKKSDRLDAERLARVARFDPELLAPIRHRGARAQADLAVLRSRLALIQARTALINHVRGSVKSLGCRLVSCSASAFANKAAAGIPEELRPALVGVVDQIASLTAKILELDRRIARLCEEHYPETRRLRQVAGVGTVTALTYVLVIEDPSRFSKSRSVGPYVGLTRRQASSGERDPELRITKQGDGEVRRLLVQAAQYVVGPFGPDTDLRRWGQELAQRGKKNAKKRALVAVARKLAVLLHRLWVTGEPYEPLRQAERRRARKVAS